jgi:hypothetical protein
MQASLAASAAEQSTCYHFAHLAASLSMETAAQEDFFILSSCSFIYIKNFVH